MWVKYSLTWVKYFLILIKFFFAWVNVPFCRGSSCMIFYSCINSTVSHISYWDQDNSWKEIWKFWNGSFCRNKSGPSPLLNVAVYWKSSNTKACAKKLSHILANNIENWGRGLVSEFMWGIVWKNEWKIKGDLEKPVFFSLDSLFLVFEICRVVLWLIGSLLDHFDLQKIEVSKLRRDIMHFCN